MSRSPSGLQNNPKKNANPAESAQQTEQPVQSSADAGKALQTEKPSDGKPKPKASLFFAFIGIFLFLVLLFLVFLVVMLLQNGGQNPILVALGIEPALLRQLLSTLVNLVFGFLSLVSFIVMIFGLFRRLTSAPAELERKKNALILTAASGLFFVFSVFLWLFLFFYISRLNIGTTGSLVILSDPPDTVNLVAPVAVTFTAREIEALYSRDGVVSYAWDLDGDGAFDDGNGLEIQYEYNEQTNPDGIYNVGLKVTLQDGREVETQKLLTISNVRPEPSFGYSPEQLEVPLDVSFDASRSDDADGSIIQYEWDFDNDGVFEESGVQVVKSFSEAGSQVVTLRVMDNNGEQVELQQSLTFGFPEEDRAVIVAKPGVSGEAPLSLTFDASSSVVKGDVESYDWDFGDNTAPASGRRVQHTFQSAGSYTVRLDLRLSDGETLSTQQVIEVEAQRRAPTAVILPQGFSTNRGVLQLDIPQTVTFDASSSRDADGRIIEYRWDFDGDGQDDAFGPTADYTFDQPGGSEVKLVVVDNQNLESSSTLVVEASIASIVVEVDVSTTSGPVPLEVTFDASASRAQTGSIISYTWDFGDGSAGVIGSARQTHVYTEVGEYTMTVEVLTDAGERKSKDVLVVAREVELQSDFSVNPQEKVAGQKVFFDGSLSKGQISRYYWDFGDGAIDRIVKPEHVYDAPGTYTVILEVYDRKDRVSRKEMNVIVGE